MKGAKLILYNSVSAFAACSTAGFMNALLMRQTELTKGIDLYQRPEDGGALLGKSKVAAKRAVVETAISRYILCIPLMFPSIIFMALEKRRLMPKNIVGLTLL